MLRAAIQDMSYSVEEDELSLEVCVVLEGFIERDVTIDFLTNDGTATGRYYKHTLRA